MSSSSCLSICASFVIKRGKWRLASASAVGASHADAGVATGVNGWLPVAGWSVSARLTHCGVLPAAPFHGGERSEPEWNGAAGGCTPIAFPATSAPVAGRWTVISEMYLTKHGEYIRQHGLPLEGKRIFIRIRQEVDDGVPLYEQIKAVVPTPEAQMGKKGHSSSNEVRRGFEGGSKGHRSITPAPRWQRDVRPPVDGGRGRKSRRSP